MGGLIEPPWWSFPNGRICRSRSSELLRSSAPTCTRCAFIPTVSFGNLPVVNGMRSLRDVPRDTHELMAGQIPNASVIVRADARWSFRNEGWRHMVAVSAPTSAVDVETWPHDDRFIQIDVQLRGRAPVVLTIREGADVLWQNAVFGRPQRVTIPCHVHAGHAHLEFEAGLEGLPQGIVANVRDEICQRCLTERVSSNRPSKSRAWNQPRP